MCILAQIPALPLLGLGPLDEALSAKVERGDEDVSVGVPAAAVIMYKEGRSFMTASIDEQIARKRAAADKQAARAAALKKELRDLEKKKAAAERKARTHRLVEVGAILEQTSGMTFDTEDSRRALSVALTEQLRYTDGTPFTRGGQIAEAVGMLLGDQK